VTPDPLLGHCLTRPGSWRDHPWNTLALGGAIPDEEILEAVDESYHLVVAKLPKKHRPKGWEG
jgi:predicted DNA-binding protein (MmcQ/YjbR family)